MNTSAPQRPGHDAFPARDDARDDVRPVPSPPRGTETVLVVEDDELVRTLLGRTLRGLGYEAHLAATGGEALALYQAHGAGIDAVLCDVVMPDISGPEAVRRMLDGAGREPAVIFMSGYTDHVLLNDGRLQHASNFLQKPLMRATLAQKLRDVLDGRRERRA